LLAGQKSHAEIRRWLFLDSETVTIYVFLPPFFLWSSRACAPRPRWSNVTGSDADRSPPSPRAHHVAAVVDDGLFVAGGTGVSGLLSDLWRRGNASSSSASKGWMLLAVGPGASLMSAGPARPHGANIVVSPWGVLSLGGMLLGTGVGEASNVRVLDPVSKLWHTVPVDHDGEVIGYSRPMGRYNPPRFPC